MIALSGARHGVDKAGEALMLILRQKKGWRGKISRVNFGATPPPPHPKQPLQISIYDNMASATNSEQDLAALKSTVSTITALIAQLQTTAPATESEDDLKAKDVNALDLAHDTTSLIKAHSTKLSLLIISNPFTATAIDTVLRELIAGPLPALASTVEICDRAKYTKAMSEELR